MPICMESIKCFLWDFDGVILDSMRIRNQGFVSIFEDYPDSLVDKLLEFHNCNGGLSRYVKIRYFFENILNRKITNDEIETYAQKFSEMMLCKLNNKDLLIQDSLSFILSQYKNFDFHIVSGSDHKELNHLCKDLGISKYFLSINGSPTPKIELVKNVITNYSYQPLNCLLIGDAINDYHAASENNIKFLGYNNVLLKEKSWFYIDSFKELLSGLNLL